MVYYESVRGCPYRCNFCNYPYLFDSSAFRYKSAERMADDWAFYRDSVGAKYITCLDSLFTIPRERLREFCRLLIARRIGLAWSCYARADDLADEATVELMREAGAHQVQIGLESGDEQLLANMNKVCTVAANQQALANCRRHGLSSVASLIVGFPGETEETLERTYQFLAETPPDFYFLATFSTRVAGVPLLQPEGRRRFGLETMENSHSMAPYWRHNTMSCCQTPRRVRELDRRLMQNSVSLNATLFYRRLMDYRPEDRGPLLELQRRAVCGHRLLDGALGRAQRWVDRRLQRDVRRQFAALEQASRARVEAAAEIQPRSI